MNLFKSLGPVLALPVFIAILFSGGGALSLNGQLLVVPLDTMETTNRWHGEGVTLSVSADCVEGKGSLQLSGSGHVRLDREALKTVDVGAYDRLVMDVKILGGQVSDFGLVTQGFPQPGALPFPRWGEYDESTPGDVWIECSFDLRLCEWNGGSANLLDDQKPALSLIYTPGKGNRGMLVDRIRLIKDPVRIAYDWVFPVHPVRVIRDGKTVRFEKEIALTNMTARLVPVLARFAKGSLKKFSGSITPSNLELKPGEQQILRAQIEIPAGLQPLDHELQMVEIVPDHDEQLMQRVGFMTAAPFPSVQHPFTVKKVAAVKDAERLLDARLPEHLPKHPCVWLSQSVLNTWSSRLGSFDQLKDEKTGDIQQETATSGGVWHRRLISQALQLGQAYRTTKDARYAQKARQLYLLYAREYHKYPLAEPISQASSYLSPNNATYILGTVVMTPITRGLDLIWDSGALTDKDKQEIMDGLLHPAALEMMKIQPGMTNMQDAMNDALLNIGLLTNDPNLVAVALFGSHGLNAKITTVFDEDGASTESVSSGYHAAALNPVLSQVASIRNSGLPVDLPFERLEKAKKLMSLLRMPDGRIPNRGDTAFPGGHADPELTGYGSLCFRNYGMTILREGEGADALYVSIDHRPPAVTHSHHDKLSMILYGKGHDFGVDEGSLYNMDGSQQQALPNWGARQAWGMHSLVHNTITVDETDQSFAGGTLLYFHGEKGGYQAVAAATDNAYAGVTLERNILLLGGVVVMVDRCLSDQSHTYDWTHHSFGGLTGPEKLTPRDKLGPQPPYSLPENVRWGGVEGPAQFTWKRDNASMRLTILPETGQPAEFATATGWANQAYQLARVEAPMVLARRKGARVAFVTVFEPFKGDAAATQKIERIPVMEAGKPVAETDAIGLKITRDDETLHYLFSFTPTEKTCGPITTKERCSAIRNKPQSLDSKALGEGSRRD